MPGQKRGARLRSGCAGHHYSFRHSGARVKRANPESRDSGSGPLDHDGVEGRRELSAETCLSWPSTFGWYRERLTLPWRGRVDSHERSEMGAGWGDALTRKLFEKAGRSPHPGPYLASLDDGPTLPLQGRVKRSSAAKLASQHLFEDLAADGFVGQRAITPPPAVALHLFGGRDKALLHFRKIGIAEVQAEDQPPRSDPAQRQALGAEVILEHPVVAGRLGILHRPDRGEVGDPNRQISAREAIVQLLRAAIPNLVQPVIDAAEVGAGEMRQEFVHRRHDVRVRVERAAGKADVGGMIVAEAAHQLLLPAHHSDRQSAGEALAVSHHVGTDAEIFLRAAG